MPMNSQGKGPLSAQRIATTPNAMAREPTAIAANILRKRDQANAACWESSSPVRFVMAPIWAKRRTDQHSFDASAAQAHYRATKSTARRSPAPVDRPGQYNRGAVHDGQGNLE